MSHLSRADREHTEKTSSKRYYSEAESVALEKYDVLWTRKNNPEREGHDNDSSAKLVRPRK